jgi:hypothetical protein
VAESPPIPENSDTRPRDIVGDQSERRRVTDPVSRSVEVSPARSVDRSSPRPVEISEPALPSTSGQTPFPVAPMPVVGALESLSEVVRGAIRDYFKSVTINGVSPDFVGSQVSFEVPVSPRASESFTVSGGVTVRQNQPIVASTPNLDAMAARQNQPIVASTPNLDAMAARNERIDSYRARGMNSVEIDRAEKALEDKESRSQYTPSEAKRVTESDDRYYDPRRMTGESNKEWQKRLEKIQFDPDTGKARRGPEDSPDAVKNGDASYFHKGMIPVYFERADGGQKVVVQLDVSAGNIVSEPPADTADYYLGGGGGGSCAGFGLNVKTVPVGNGQQSQLWIGPGTIGGELPPNFDPIEGKLIATSGSGYVAALVTIDQSDPHGSIGSVQIDGGYSSFPADSNTDYYYVLGYYEFTSDGVEYQNYGCGSLEVRVCRRFYVADSLGPWTVSVSRYT